jgi:hypothetical protein
LPAVHFATGAQADFICDSLAILSLEGPVVPLPQRIQHLNLACEKARLLLQNLQHDQASVADDEAGMNVYQAAIDATQDTADNLNRALRVAPCTSSSD